MNCDQYRAALLAGDPVGSDHLSTCASCRVEHQTLLQQRELLADPALWEEPKRRIVDLVVAEVAGQSKPKPRWFLAAVVAGPLVILGLSATLWMVRADWRVSVPATEEARGATAMISGWNTDMGSRLLLEVNNLPPAPPRHFYEVWFTSDQTHVSAGTFHTSGRFELWAGVQRRDYPRIWITLEPADGYNGPSPLTVFDTG